MLARLPEAYRLLFFASLSGLSGGFLTFSLSLNRC